MKNLIDRGRHLRSERRFLRTIIVGSLLASTLVAVATPTAQAAPVPCSASSLVSAIGAVASSGGTVTLTAGCTYTLTTVNSTVDGPSAFADIVGNVTVVGNGATVTRSNAGGTPDFRFFIIDDGGALSLSNLTLSNGSITNVVNEAHGGAAIINRSVLTVSDVNFVNNHEQGSNGTGGGAIDNHDKGVLTVTNSTFSGNVAPQGGAIEDEATLCHTTDQSPQPQCGQTTVTNSTFTGNSTTMFGGGAFESQLDASTPAQCAGSLPYPAECQQVGGAHDYLTGDTFVGNTAAGEGGGIANFGTTTVLNSTVTSNTAGTAGGGGVQNTGTMTITFSTVAGNTSQFGSDIHSFTDATHVPGATTITMSIVSAGSAVNCSGSVAMTDGGYNIDDGTSCGFTINALNSTNPALSPLASNGGPTQTMAPQGGSPAIDAIPGVTAGCGGTDQRGLPRPQNGACDIGSVEVFRTPPTVPAGLAATANGGHEIDLNWSASSSPIGVAGYDIFREGTKIATVSGVTLTYADMGLTDATTYHYTVDAFDSVGNTSSQSAPAMATTPDVTAPSVPTGLHASVVSGHEIDLSWSASTDNVGVTGYDVYRNASNTPLATVSGSTLAYADTTVSDATSYTYTVDAFDAAGNHSLKSASAGGNTPDVTPPSVPGGVTATALTTTPQVNVSWNASTDNAGVTGYTIYRGGTKLATVSGSTLTYGDTTVVGLTHYSYTVDAFDAAGNHSAQSTAAGVTTPDYTPPSVPTGVTATAAATRKVTVTWSASTDNVGVTGYTVYRNGTSVGTVSGTTLVFVDTTVAPSTAYSYTVDAFDAAGNHSAQSAAAHVSTPSFACPTGYSGQILTGDFTGDGKVDQVLVTLSGQCVLLSNGSSYAAPTTWSVTPFYGSTATLAGDVTGDGKADLVAVNSTNTFVSVSNGSSFQAPTKWSNVPFYGTRGTFLADVNGDGKADLVAINNGSVWVMLSNGTSFGAPVLWSNVPFYGTRGTFLADVSGDGKTDLVAVNDSSVWVMLSTGSAFGSPTLWSSTPFYGNVMTTVADVTGDGKADLVAVNTSSIWVLRSSGAAFASPALWSSVPFYGNITTMVVDATGGGKADMVALNTDGSAYDVWVSSSTGSGFGTPSRWL
jgi:chitodextrinase